MSGHVSQLQFHLFINRHPNSISGFTKTESLFTLYLPAYLLYVYFKYAWAYLIYSDTAIFIVIELRNTHTRKLETILIKQL
jgi:hypothetical protein